MPRVSVGLPVYNGERFITQAIESILSQTFADLELVVSDNGSSDGTEEICRSYAGRDSRVRYHRSPVNRGAAWNYNRVFALSSGVYFKWAAHDDVCAPELLERCVEVLDRNPSAVLAYCRNRIIDEVGQPIGQHEDGFDLRSPRASERLAGCLRESGRCNPIFGLIRSAALRTTPLIGTYIASDYIILAELALRGEFHEIPDRLFFNRDHPARSGRALRTLRQHSTWYNPRATGTPWRWWRLSREYFRAIGAAPLDGGERARCYWLVMKWVRWNLGALVSEIVEHTRYTRNAAHT